MKNLKLTLSVVCAVLLLTGGQLFGQNKKGRGDVMTPVKADNFKEMAAKLSNDGWKTDSYTIEEQLASTAKFKCEINPKIGDALYLWSQVETSGSNLKDVREKNYITGMTNLTYQVELPFGTTGIPTIEAVSFSGQPVDVKMPETLPGKVELTVLRIAVYEMLFDEDIPDTVAINEAIEIAKKYGQAASGSFVNAVLAKFVKKQEA